MAGFSVAVADTSPKVFLPTDDAYVKSSKPDKNYGEKDTLRIKVSNKVEYRTYIKFAVSGLDQAPQSATLRLYVTDGSPDGGAVYAAGNDYQTEEVSWEQSVITWKNAPAIEGEVIASNEDVADNRWMEFDVSYVVSDNGTFTFAVTSSASNSAYYSSLEGKSPPELVVR